MYAVSMKELRHFHSVNFSLVVDIIYDVRAQNTCVRSRYTNQRGGVVIIECKADNNIDKRREVVF